MSDDRTSTAGTGARRRVGRVGLVAGPLAGAALAALLPDAAGPDAPGLDPAGRATAAVAVWMAIWWISEAIEVYATALLPLVLLPLLGARTMHEAAAPYAHPLIFLFLGGFLLALAMERWGLHRRLALLALNLVGERPARLVGGFMAVTAGLSMWVSNSATAVMMLPVAVSVIELAERGGASGRDPSQSGAGADPPTPAARNFALCLLLGVAYGASIGGIATPIGTPPNLFLLSFVQDHLGREISFVRWMGVGLSLVALFLPLAWWLLTRVLYPVADDPIEGGGRFARASLAALGPMSRGERITLAVFLLAAGLWLTRPWLSALEVAGVRPLAGLTDPGIAMLAALLLFLAPVDRRRRVFALRWETTLRLPWGVLLLFGGGLSLAGAIRDNGIGELIGGQATALAGLPSVLVVAGVVAVILFLTELTSNTATTATLIPILAAVAPGLGLDPLLLLVPAALAASCAFMLPVATPPNAVVFGSGRVTIPEMSRAGIWLNLLGIGIVTLVTYAVAAPLLVR